MSTLGIGLGIILATIEMNLDLFKSAAELFSGIVF